MNKFAYALLVVSASLGADSGFTQERPVLAQEYTGAPGAPVIWWTRRENEYTLQLFTGMVVPKSDAQCETSRREPPAGVDRGSFFIGNTIACLRGLDPTFGARTLTLTEGRRARDATPAEGLVASPPVAELPPPVTAAQPAREVQVWLLHRDGSVIAPQRKSPMDPERKFCGYRGCESGFVYGFDLAAGTEAVAVAYMVGDSYHVQKLRPFEDEQE